MKPKWKYEIRYEGISDDPSVVYGRRAMLDWMEHHYSEIEDGVYNPETVGLVTIKVTELDDE